MANSAVGGWRCGQAFVYAALNHPLQNSCAVQHSLWKEARQFLSIPQHDLGPLDPTFHQAQCLAYQDLEPDSLIVLRALVPVVVVV